MITPLPSETGTAIEETKGPATTPKGAKLGKKRNLQELLSMSFDGFKYSDWVAEYNLTVSCSIWTDLTYFLTIRCKKCLAKECNALAYTYIVTVNKHDDLLNAKSTHS